MKSELIQDDIAGKAPGGIGIGRQADDTAAVSLKPVITPLDGQVKEHNRARVELQLKKAAGAEGQANDLGLDLSRIRPERNKYRDVKLFDER